MCADAKNNHEQRSQRVESELRYLVGQADRARVSDIGSPGDEEAVEQQFPGRYLSLESATSARFASPDS
jgi:hypothetical protein